MDFVTVLENEYRKRTEKNQNYSLRAFARDLHIDQSSLSKVLARKRQLSNELIIRISSNLGLSPSKLKKFLLPNSANLPHPNYNDLEYDKFVVVADWYHDAILELIDTASFRPDTGWIASRLEIKESQVKSAVRRLKKVNLLEITENGTWVDRSKMNSLIPEDISLEALKSYQKQILNKSTKAIDVVSLPERSHTSITFSASKENLEKAKRLIAKCRRDVAALLRESSEPKSEVYQLQVSLFPITKQYKGDQS